MEENRLEGWLLPNSGGEHLNEQLLEFYRVINEFKNPFMEWKSLWWLFTTGTQME
jgi:hypothetical protein